MSEEFKPRNGRLTPEQLAGLNLHEVKHVSKEENARLWLQIHEHLLKNAQNEVERLQAIVEKAKKEEL